MRTESGEKSVQKGKLEIARKMKAYEILADLIAKYTGLSLDKIGNL